MIVFAHRLQRSVKASAEAEYPAYGVTGPTRDKLCSPGDRKLAQSAQMYHYQHQKQQMLAMEKWVVMIFFFPQQLLNLLWISYMVMIV